jgi:formate dehydrogenase maturation protein FdhE
MKVIEKTKCLSCDHISDKSVDAVDDKGAMRVRFVTNCPQCKGAKSSMHKMLFEAKDSK